MLALAVLLAQSQALLAGEPPGPDDGGYNDIHLHPVEPFTLRFALTARS